VRAALASDDWTVTVLVRQDGEVVGTQGLSGKDYAATREVSTGSWLGRTHQGQGIGTEMRSAVLLLAFDHLGAGTARSGAFIDNIASLAVSRKLGYRPDGTYRRATRAACRRDQAAAHLGGVRETTVDSSGRGPRRLPHAAGCLTATLLGA
jgi:RimJ/RimL family protein N-acetyltransferase